MMFWISGNSENATWLALDTRTDQGRKGNGPFVFVVDLPQIPRYQIKEAEIGGAEKNAGKGLLNKAFVMTVRSQK